jgi:hypothetical protein
VRFVLMGPHMAFSTDTSVRPVISSTEKRFVSEEAEENGEWREVEEASSVVIVPGNILWNDHRGI